MHSPSLNAVLLHPWCRTALHILSFRRRLSHTTVSLPEVVHCLKGKLPVLLQLPADHLHSDEFRLMPYILYSGHLQFPIHNNSHSLLPLFHRLSELQPYQICWHPCQMPPFQCGFSHSDTDCGIYSPYALLRSGSPHLYICHSSHRESPHLSRCCLPGQ